MTSLCEPSGQTEAVACSYAAPVSTFNPYVWQLTGSSLSTSLTLMLCLSLSRIVYQAGRWCAIPSFSMFSQFWLSCSCADMAWQQWRDYQGRET